MKPAFVYFITSEDKYVKIGIANDVEIRLKDLNIGNPIRLKVLYKFSVSSSLVKKIENYLHYKFREDNIHGEWFNLSQKIKNFIFKHKTLNKEEKEDYNITLSKTPKTLIPIDTIDKLETLISLYNKGIWIDV